MSVYKPSSAMKNSNKQQAHDLAGLLVMGADAERISEIAERLFEAISRADGSHAERLIAIAHVAAIAIMVASADSMNPDLLRRAFDDLTETALKVFPETRNATH